jgi:hypothetical protein
MSSAISIDEVGQLHRRAMELCDRALLARTTGDQDLAIELFRESFETESRAAALVVGDLALEPTRSILHRSAATLALDCSDFRAAERLIAAALAGNPPEEIAEELRDLLEQVNFGRHLDLRGLRLAPNEIQLSIAGKKVGFGIILSEEFVDRVQATEKMILRTFERRMGRPFREAGPALKEISKNCEVYLSTPRAGSFAATMRVGLPDRTPALAGLEFITIDEPEQIIDELTECLDSYIRGDDERLGLLITDPAYLRNFIALADQLLPDGENISQVGFTVSRDRHTKSIALIRRERPKQRTESAAENGHLSVVGRLLFADATSASANRIKVVDDEGKTHLFDVPEGMMADIVKPLWEDRVEVDGVKHKGRKVASLERIGKAPGAAN